MSSGAGPGYAANFVAQMLRAGLGPTAGLRSYREAGGEIRTQAWYRAWGEVAASVANREAVALAPLNRRPAAAEISRWSVRRPGGYLYQVQAQVRARGTSEVYTTMTSLRSDRLVTYGAALQGALDPFASNVAEYGEIVLGGTVVGVYSLDPMEG